MSKKVQKKTEEKPKRIFKETMDIEIPKSMAEILEDKEKVKELALKKFDIEQSIEKAKTALKKINVELTGAVKESEQITRDEEREVTVKIFAKSMKKEIWEGDKFVKEEEACSWELQAEIDDLNANENMSEINGEEEEDQD